VRDLLEHLGCRMLEATSGKDSLVLCTRTSAGSRAAGHALPRAYRKPAPCSFSPDNRVEVRVPFGA
jgi:hypothetical protein